MERAHVEKRELIERRGRGRVLAGRAPHPLLAGVLAAVGEALRDGGLWRGATVRRLDRAQYGRPSLG